MFLNNWQIFIIGIVLFFNASSAYGQDSIMDPNVRVNAQFWIDYNFSKSDKETRDISTQIGFRKIAPQVYDRFLAISTANFDNLSENKWLKLINSFHLGTGVIYTSNYDANDNLEFRLNQGVRYNIKTVKFLTIHNYVRLEERIQTSFDKDWTLGFRLRYKVSTEIIWDKHFFGFTEGLYFPLEAEVFFNLKKTDRFNDLIRLSPGIGFKMKSGWRFEAFLIYNRTKNITETSNNSSDFILRIRIRDERFKTVENSSEEEILGNGIE